MLYIPILACGFVRSYASAAYERVAFTKATPFCRRRAWWIGLTEFPCCRADRAVRRKGLMDRPNTDIIRTEYRQGKEKDRRIGSDEFVSKLSRQLFFKNGLG